MSLSLPAKKPSTNGKTALIDGDILVYRVGFACETKDENGEPVAEPKQNAFHSINVTIDSILENTNCSDYEVYLTGKDNFREGIATILPYKGNRTGRKPLLYDEIRDFLIGRHKAIVVHGQEADDELSIRAYELGDKAVLCSLDKDLDMVEGSHYNWVKDTMYEIDSFEATKNFYTQMLTGDKVDNIQGIPGIGPKKAERLLVDCFTPQEMHQSVLGAYSEYYEELTDEEVDEIMVETATLLWMRRKRGEKDFVWPE